MKPLLLKLRITPALRLAAALAVSCAATPFVGSLSPQAAAREAWRDIASGRMKLYRAGGRASTEVGVEPEDRDLVRRLPRDDSLSHGCDDPNLSFEVEYARAYNVRIVRYLRLHQSR
jgi:acetyl-CoA acetyltransferase